MGQLLHVHPVVPNLILNLEMRNFPLAGRLEHLLKATQKVDFRSKNRLQFGANSKKGTTANKNVISRFKSGKGHAEKRWYSKSFSQKSAVCEQFVLSKQKG